MRKRITSLLLTLVMLLSLVPAMGVTALAADSYPAANAVSVDGGKDFSSSRYYKNGNESNSFTGTSTDYNAAYDSATGTLTLNDYDGGRITLGGASNRDLTIKLIGNNTVTVGSDAGIVATSTGCNIIITADNGSNGKLTINATSGSGDAYGIGTGLATGAVSGNVTIKGYADVIINATTNGSTAYSFGIYAGEVAIKDHAKVAIYAKAQNNTVDDQVYGIYAKTNVTIDTAGEITVDASNAENEANVYSTGVNSMGTLTLTKAGRMTVKWKGNSGVPFYPKKSFNATDHAINVDKPNCYASYRYGTPHTVEVVDGTVTGPGVPYAKDNGKFLENDTVNIKPYEPKGKSGEDIPFKGWTSSDVSLSSPATANNSFTVPGKDVTVTAKHNPFDGTPTFTPTGTTNTDGTLTFQTMVRLGDGTECFYLVKDGEQNNESKYKSFPPDNSPSTRPYEYIYKTRTLPGGNQVDAGDYYVVELLNGKYYLSEKFTVSYTAAPTTYTVSFDANGGTGTMADVTNISGNYTLPACTFTAPSDKQFKGWATSASGAVITDASINVTENTTLYAIWEPIPVTTYTVSFDANGGTGTMADVTGVTGSYTLPACTFTAPSDKQFKGWATSASGTVITGTSINVTENTTLYAIWEPIPVTKPAITTVTLPDGKVGDAYSQTLAATGTNPIAWSIKTGDLPDGLTLVGDTIKGTPSKAGEFKFIVKATNVGGSDTKELTIKIANAEASKYHNVTLSDAGTGATGAGSHAEGTTVNIYAGTKSGYTFNGWTSDDVTVLSASSKNASFVMPNKDVTVKANWVYTGGGSTGGGYTYYTIKATAGVNGSISPSGNVSVREGRDQTFTITPDKGYAVANVKIDGKSIGAVKSYTFENVRRTHTIEVIFMKANGNPQTGVFVDVATGSYYEDAVDWAVENGITTGVSANRFDPNGVCTRAQAVTFLWRAAGSPAPRSRTMPFTDVPVGSYYYDAVLWAVENGITKGTSETMFSPDATCSRAQIVAFLWRSEKSPAAGSRNPFADVKSTAYYADAVLWAVKEDITKGSTNTTFSPDADCTRAQIVTFLWRCKK